jgi:hypothetical protein
MAIEQIYCTHCTYGTSALEQREGELADRVLGYSARAGSAERNELRNDYRAIERFLYYYLPADTPPEEKQRLDAAGAPRRLFFCPSMGRLQMVGQVAYRQYDTAGRLGSYFAHVLFGDRSAGGWSALDCLRLWNAPWVQEDSAEHPFKLPALERLDDVWAGAPPAIGDDALLRFLQSIDEGRASSPSPETGNAADGLGRPPHYDELIAPRWQTSPAQQRIDLVANVLQGLLALGTQRRDNILLVVEPSVAALVFYGVARLLPKSLAEGLSFSTYEPNAERLPVTLAATTFFDPHTADVRSDLYRRRGLVINTFQDRMSETGPPSGDYARFIIERLLEDGWPVVDRLLEGFAAAGAKQPADLESLVPAHRAVSQVLSATPPDDSWRKSDLAARYLAREVQYQLATAPEGWPQLHRVIGTPNHLTVLELVTSEPSPPDLQRPAQFLLKRFPPEKIAELVASPLLGREAKLAALASYTATQERLPDGCQLFCENGGWAKSRSGDSLLPDLLARLPDPVLRRVHQATDEAQQKPFLQSLLTACTKQGPSVASLKQLLLEIISQLDDEAFLDLLAQHTPQLQRCFPSSEPALATRLGKALYNTPEHPKRFEKRLAVLDGWKSHFLHPHLAERRLGEWNKVRSCLIALRDREEKASTGRLQRLKQRVRGRRPPDFKPLAEALGRAMPCRNSELAELAEVVERCSLDVPQFKSRLEMASRHLGCPVTFDQDACAADLPANCGAAIDGPTDELEQLNRRREQQARMLQMFRELEERLLVYADDKSGKHKLQVLQRVGQVLLPHPELLLEGRRKIELYFENGVWPTVHPLKTHSGRFKLKYPTKKRRWMPFALVGAVLAFLVPLVGHFVLGGRHSSLDTTEGPTKNDAIARAADTKPKDHPSNRRVDGPHDEKHWTDKAASVTPKATEPVPKAAEVVSPPSAASENHRPAPTGGGNDDVSPDTKSLPNNGPSSLPSTATNTDKPPAPTSPQPTAKQPPTEPAIRLVDEHRVLPKLNDVWLDLRLPLDEWSAEPGEIMLKLHGLQSANDWLANRIDGQLTVSSQAQALQVAAHGSGAERALGKFLVKKHDVAFQWLGNFGGERPSSAYYTGLRRCVLEVTGGPKSVFIALAKPIMAEEMAFKAGTLTFDLHQMGATDLEPAQDDELLLGFGSLEVDNDCFAFGDAASATPRSRLRDLPEQYKKTEAQLELAKATDDGDLTWVIRIGGGDGPAGESAAKARLPLKSVSEKISTLRGSGNDLSAFDAAATALAADLGIEAPARPAANAKESEKNAYKTEVRKVVLAPAKERHSQLMQLKSLREHYLKLSAVIYRRVTPTMFVRYLVMGHPEPPSTNQEGADDDRPDKTN